MQDTHPQNKHQRQRSSSQEQQVNAADMRDAAQIAAQNIIGYQYRAEPRSTLGSPCPEASEAIEVIIHKLPEDSSPSGYLGNVGWTAPQQHGALRIPPEQ